ncbi:transglycosylase SLT domain-containing protein [Oceanospirillum sanctuarii]|uniref:transglycosylase SLT domain-containing protein n=1 Tax=Oceanospirillum sanctuarii TaxID=1434821 RepID=UPI001FE42E1C|nr:transglycosylase SLT domain-containing protein [Oceanospirillum sanctuarii]
MSKMENTRTHLFKRFGRVKRQGLGLIALALTLVTTGCAVAPPQKPDSACDIFRQYPDWYISAKQSEEKWGTPVPILMAFIHQESSFKPDAQPERTTFLGIIPGPRKSSSYGYTQALDSTWKEYQDKTGNRHASRGSFHDAVDFIGWYNYQGFLRNGIERNNTYYMYIAYHEGHGGYADKTWKNKSWLKDVSTKVANRAIEYHKQLEGCRATLNRGASWWVF